MSRRPLASDFRPGGPIPAVTNDGIETVLPLPRNYRPLFSPERLGLDPTSFGFDPDPEPNDDYVPTIVLVGVALGAFGLGAVAVTIYILRWLKS